MLSLILKNQKGCHIIYFAQHMSGILLGKFIVGQADPVYLRIQTIDQELLRNYANTLHVNNSKLLTTRNIRNVFSEKTLMLLDTEAASKCNRHLINRNVKVFKLDYNYICLSSKKAYN